MAIDSLNYLEEIHSYLTKYLDYTPDFTNVVIKDIVDSANGSARVVPYNLIHIYPYAPASTSELGHYKDWLYILLLHEYTHIVHIDTKGKIPKFLNKIFGKTMAPNQVLPKWITEGIAVYLESYFTSYGRINSPYYQMLFRNSILNQDITLSEVSNFTNHYPYGGIAYLYGSFFIDYIFKKDISFKKLSSFSHSYSKNILPYGINRALKGNDFKTLFKKFKKFYKKKYSKLAKKIKKNKITKYKRILKFDKKYILPIFHDKKISGKNVSELCVSDDNKLYLLSRGPENNSSLYRYENEKTQKIIDFDASVSNIEIRDNILFYISKKLFKNKSINNFMYLDLKTKKQNTLSSLRVVNFRLNPIKNESILVVNERGIQNLYLLDLNTRKYKKLTNFKEYTTIGVPEFISKDSFVISMNRKNKFWDLYLFDMKNNRLEILLEDNYLKISPSYDKENNILYFIANFEDDILNIYKYNFYDKKIYKKSNFISGVKKVIYKNGNLYALRYQQDNGFEAIRLLTEKNKLINKKEKIIDYNILPYKKNVNYKKQDFSIFPEILPKNFYPEISSNNFKTKIALEVKNNDVRNYIGYNFYLAYLKNLNDLMFSFSLSSHLYKLSYSFSYSYSPSMSENLILNSKKISYNSQYHNFYASFFYPFKDYYGFSSLYFAASYSYFTFSKIDYNIKPWYKEMKFPLERDSVNFSFGFFYSKTTSRLNIPGIAEGDSFNLRFTIKDKDIYSDYNYFSTYIQAKKYFPIDILDGAIYIIYNLSFLYSESGIVKQNIGGYPDYGNILDKLIDRTSVGGTYLRGYPTNFFEGNLFNLVNLAYKQNLFYFKNGYSTLPFYLNKVYFRIFYDIANVTDKFYEINLKMGLGFELITSFILGYYQGYNLAIGYNRGLNEGINKFYVNFVSIY